MAEFRVAFQQRKFVLNWCCKSVNVCEAQRCWGCEVVIEALLCDEFMTDIGVQEVYKQRYWRNVMCEDCYM